MNCPICEASDFEQRRIINSRVTTVPSGLDRGLHVNSRIDQCKKCGLFRSTQLRGQDSKESVSFEASASKVSIAGARPTLSTDELTLLGTSPPASLLDVGCGAGQFLLRAQQAGYRVQGIDPDFKSVQFVTQELGLPAREGTLSNLASSERFDVISMMGVLEHIADPTRFLMKARGHLSPNGELLLGVPNVMSLNRWVSRLSSHDWDMFLEPGHLFHYSYRTARMLGARAGLHMVRWRTATITIRGKVPFLPHRFTSLEHAMRSASTRIPLFGHAYNSGLRLLDQGRLGDTLLAVFRSAEG